MAWDTFHAQGVSFKPKLIFFHLGAPYKEVKFLNTHFAVFTMAKVLQKRPSQKNITMISGPEVSVHWFRHGLRLHDNPALLESLRGAKKFYPIYIFDGQVAGSATAGYNRMRFFLDSIRDLDEQFREAGGRLFAFQGQPVPVLRALFKEWSVTRLTFEEEPEAIWHERDSAVRQLCREEKVQCISQVSHTLWDPKEVFKRRGNSPPLTYEDFCMVAVEIGDPPRPVARPTFAALPLKIGTSKDAKYNVPEPEDLGAHQECPEQTRRVYLGGERKGLQFLEIRLAEVEQKRLEEYRTGNDQSVTVSLLEKPTSLSAYLRYGCVSVRQLFWSIQDLVDTCALLPDQPPLDLTGQLLWRDFFYVMSHRNLRYDKMINNPVCLEIPWFRDECLLDKWKNGRTGFPWIDAGMRQLKQEGWIHHVARHATACFLTRGDLWLNWEEGATFFYALLIDGDWAVNSGNWMWVSSSAFERALQSPVLLDPVAYGQQMDPTGDYIRKYVPEVRNFPLELLFCPWKASSSEQNQAECVIGEDYPFPCVDHETVMERNTRLMEVVRAGISGDATAQFCAPSSTQEVLAYVRLPDRLMDTILESVLFEE